MTLDDIREYLLINSLQYFIGADDIEVTDEVLQGLVQRALTTYANWRPLHTQTELYISDYVSTIKYDSEGRRIQNIINLYFFEPILAGNSGAVPWNWDYNKDNGQFRTEITGTYTLEILVAGKLEDYDTETSELMEMILGLYMMYIGSSRKAFTFGDQPFENDGADIYADGKELWETTLESLKTEQDNWYLSIL
jgi:hypothetical protein